MFKRKKKFQIPVSAYEYRMILDALMSSREKTTEDECTDDNADDDFNGGVDIALTGLVLKGGLCADNEFVCLVLCLAEEILDLVHVFTSYFLFCFCLLLDYGWNIPTPRIREQECS